MTPSESARSRLAERFRTVPEGAILRNAFRGLLVVAVVMIVLDFRDLVRAGGETLMPATAPVRMDRTETDDQVRPYLPRTRPLAPGEQVHHRPHDTAEAEPMRFRLGTHGAAFADGTIVPGTADELDSFLASSGAAGVTELVLHSPGGSVRDAFVMAKLLREKELSTRILPEGYCASSCPILFAAGVERVAAPTSWIGVHQVFALNDGRGTLADGMDQGQRVSAEAQTLLEEFGVDPKVWVHAMQTPHDSLYLFTPEELIDLKLATEVEGPAPAEPTS